MSNTSSGKSEVSALVSMIANSAGIIESCYERSSKPYVPSLNDLEPHPLDAELSSLELKTATQILEGACAQLCALLTRPNHNLMNKFLTFLLPASLNTVINAKVVDAIGTNPNGMHIDQISEKTGLEPKKLGRIVRFLCAHHIFKEVSTDTFANTRLSIQLQSSNPLAPAGLHLVDEQYKAAGYLYETLSDPEWGRSEEPHHAAFNKQSGYPGPLFTYYAGKDNDKGAEYGARLGRGLAAFNSVVEARAVIREYPWGDLPDGTVVNDFGGSVGTISMLLVKAYPNLKLILQDLPERIAQAESEVWPQQCPEAIRDNRIEFKGFDFFKDSPVANCDIYYLKHVLHNWPDPAAIKILVNVRKAMGPNSRVLIHEHIVQPANRVPDKESSLSQAPEPLLPNFGIGRMRQYSMDLGMLSLLNSQARRCDDFIKLAKVAGLEYSMQRDFGEMGVVEFRLPKA